MANELDRLRTEVGAIVARHAATKGLVNFTKYADDPVGFLRDVLKCDPWSAQIEMAEAVRDNPRVCIVSANSMGKDFLVARLCLWHVYARRGLAIMTSVTDRQARRISMAEVRRAFLNAPALPGELFQMELRVDDGSGIIAFTSDSADRLVGFHHPRLLLCLSEAQGLEAEVFEAAHACATGEENKIIIYGNPTRPVGTFHTAATSDNWRTLTIPASAHPNIITGREEIPGGPSVAWIASMAEEYGRDSSIFRARVLSEWPTESVEGLVKREWLRAAFDRHDARVAAADTRRKVLALDVARFGPDMSCLAVVQGADVEQLITWRGKSTTESGDAVIAHAESLRSPVKGAGDLRYWNDPEPLPRPSVIIDEPGLGAGTIDVMRSKGWQVEAFNGAAQSPDPRRFLNLRAASHWKFRELLEQNLVALPRDAALEEEALAVEWTLAPNGTIQVVAKDLIRKALGRSPDRLDAVVMGLWQSIGVPSQQWGSSRWTY